MIFFYLLYSKMIIRDVFSDLLHTDLKDFDIPKDKYWNYSLSQIANLILTNKEVLLSHLEFKWTDERIMIFKDNEKNEISMMFAISQNIISITDNDNVLIITIKDREILNTHKIFTANCSVCNSNKQKDDENKDLFCCNKCKLIKYCCSYCQSVDCETRHNLVCKRLHKVMNCQDKIYANGPVYFYEPLLGFRSIKFENDELRKNFMDTLYEIRKKI